MATPEYDLAKFRLMYPEFRDVAKYPDAMIELYGELAAEFITSGGCPCSSLSGNRAAIARMMLTAHLLALSAQSEGTGTAQSGASSSGGIELSASIGEVSISSMAPPATDGWQFWLAQTPYGQSLWALLGLASVGGFSVGGLPERSGFRKIGGVFL